MTRADRRREQSELQAEYQRQQNARQDEPYDAPPPRTSPRYCPQSRDGEHFWSRSKDGLRRCFCCGATKEEPCPR